MKTFGNIKGELIIACYPEFGPIFIEYKIRIYNNAFTTFKKGLNYNMKKIMNLMEEKEISL